MNVRNFIITLIVFSLVILTSVPVAFAGPKITKVELGQAVTEGYYVVAIDTSNPYSILNPLQGIWINPNENVGDTSTVLTEPAASTSHLSVAAEGAGIYNAGNKKVYPAILIALSESDVSASQVSLGLSFAQNPVQSENPDVALIKINKDKVDLKQAIPAGTEVTFTVDMEGEPLHMLAVMGGTAPEVTYDQSTGMATIKTTTFSTTNANGQEFSSIVGFMLVTNSQGGDDPLRIIFQTDIWGGDVIPYPSITDDPDETMGTVNNLLGITAYGPAEDDGNVYVFFPDIAINPVFGASSGVQPTDLAIFLGSDQLEDSGSTVGVDKLGVIGTELTATYTFSSTSKRDSRGDTPKKDVTVGVRSDPVCVQYDVDGDGKPGLAEVITILKGLTGGSSE